MGQNCLEYPDRPCYGLDKAKEIEERLNSEFQKASNTHQEIFNRLRMVELEQRETTVRFGHIMDSISNVKKSIETIDSSLEEIKSKPAKRWEGIVSNLISVIIGALVTFILVKIGIA